MKPYEQKTKDWVEMLEAFCCGAIDVLIAVVKATLSCLCIIASNPIGAIMLFLFFLWAIC